MSMANAEKFGGWHRKGLGEDLYVPSDRHGSAAFAVGMRRDIEKKRRSADDDDGRDGLVVREGRENAVEELAVAHDDGWPEGRKNVCGDAGARVRDEYWDEALQDTV